MAKKAKPTTKKLVATVPLAVYKAIRHEAIDRGMTLGELVAEAFQARTFVIDRSQPQETTQQ